jgi:hypothetical protein
MVDEDIMLAQLRQYNLNVLFVISSSLTKDKSVIDKYQCKLRQSVPRVETAISIGFGRIEQIVHD